MSNPRMYDGRVRIRLASPLAFADWENPTASELNANPSNDPNGLIWDITCATDRANSTFDLGAADTNDSLSFCQRAGDKTATNFNPEIVLSIFRSDTPWLVSDDTTRNTANLAFSLLAWRGIEYFAIISIDKAPGTDFAVNDEIKMARVGTSDPTDGVGTGESVTLTNNLRPLGDLLWNYTVEA